MDKARKSSSRQGHFINNNLNIHPPSFEYSTAIRVGDNIIN